MVSWRSPACYKSDIWRGRYWGCLCCEVAEESFVYFCIRMGWHNPGMLNKIPQYKWLTQTCLGKRRYFCFLDCSFQCTFSCIKSFFSGLVVKLHKGENFVRETWQGGLFFDPFLYFHPKQLFLNILIMKITNVVVRKSLYCYFPLLHLPFGDSYCTSNTFVCVLLYSKHIPMHYHDFCDMPWSIHIGMVIAGSTAC